MKRRYKVLGGVLVGIGIVLICVGTYLFNNSLITIYHPKAYESSGNTRLDKKLSSKEAKEDIYQIISTIEDTHPIFLEKVPESYNKAKYELLKKQSEETSVGQLQIELNRYLASIQDGHTHTFWNERKWLDVNWKYINNKLILLDKDNNITNKEVIMINDKKTDQIIKFIKDIFPSENYMASEKNSSIYSKSSLILENLGIDTSDKVSVLIRDIDKNKEEVMSLGYTNDQEKKFNNHEISSEKIDKNTIYIKLGICEENEQLDKVVKELKKSMKDSVKNVIIDVRDNPGGNSNACSKLLDAINIVPGNFGATIRFSKLAQERFGYAKSHGYVIYDRRNEVVKNEDINLYVLTNENTFSSAQWLATWIQDGKLGIIVGQGSSNMPSSFGDVITFQLNNSKIECQVSYKKWLRPDVSKDSERTLEPDVKVEYNKDSLEKTLELIDS